ncbi:MAG: pyridoxamine 5'-phosphate oxidase family protein [Acidihalobacter sp.]
MAETDVFPCTSRNKVRKEKQASYERECAYVLVDRLKTGHLAFVENGEPRSIPITVWRDGDHLYVHTLNKGRLARILETGCLVCLSFADCQQWVLAKSAYHHSANYESAVLYCRGERVSDPQVFDEAFKAIIEQLEPGRWEQVRPPNVTERKATALIRLAIEEGSYKCRTGGPNEEPEDLELPVWHGVRSAKGC